MVQTSLGAKSNPWIAYMKQCRLNYNSVKSETKPSEIDERTQESQIKKPSKRGAVVENRTGDDGTRTAKRTKTTRTVQGVKDPNDFRTLATFLPGPNPDDGSRSAVKASTVQS
jgi:hypothetical protein